MKLLLVLVLAGGLLAESPNPFVWKPEPYAPASGSAQAPPPVSTPASAPAPVVKKKSHKTTWIVVGVVAGSAAVALAITAKRLNNEGAGILKF